MNEPGGIHHFFLPHAGGSAADLLDVAKAFCDAPRRHLLELPGRGRRRREAFIYDGETAIADLYAQLMSRLNVNESAQDQPLVFFGHSFGAYMAWMLARRFALQHSNVSIAVVAVSNTPLHRRRDFKTSSNLNLQNDAAQLSELVSFVDTLGGVPASIRKMPYLFERFSAVLAADLAVADSLPWNLADLRGRLPLISGHGTSDPVCQTDQHHWPQLSTGPHIHLELPGGHFLPMESPVRLAEMIKSSDIYRHLSDI